MLSRNEVKQALRQQRIETPSWAYRNIGTRFMRAPSMPDRYGPRGPLAVAPAGEAEVLSCETTAGPPRYTARVITSGQCDGAGESSRTIRFDN